MRDTAVMVGAPCGLSGGKLEVPLMTCSAIRLGEPGLLSFRRLSWGRQSESCRASTLRIEHAV